MSLDSRTTLRLRAATVTLIALGAFGLTGCSGDVTPVDKAEAQVAAKEKALTEAQAAFTDASADFCAASETYITALDRYGDVLNSTAPTVGDVTDAGAELTKPRAAAFNDAEAARTANEQVTVAEQELADAQDELAKAVAGSSAPPSDSDSAPATTEPLVPAASVERVEQAEEEFASAQEAVTPETPLADASEQFNSAAVALEFAWLGLVLDTGCVDDEQKEQADSTIRAYTTTLQENLTETGYYSGGVDGVYGPQTVAAVEELQKANGLPETGTLDKATAAALTSELAGNAGADAQESVATTAAIQQTLKLAGYWDGPVDGEWTDALTEAVKTFQTDLGVEATGEVDSATIKAFEKALEELQAPDPEPSSEPSSTEEP